MKRKLYQEISHLLQAVENCRRTEWETVHSERLEQLVERYMPFGSGIDHGTKIDIGESTPERIVLRFKFHHRNDVGMYTQWTSHECIVTPSFSYGFDLEFTGMNQVLEGIYSDDNGQLFDSTAEEHIGDYLYDTFRFALCEIDWSDKFCTCHNCYKAFRCSADSSDGFAICGDCIKEDPNDTKCDREHGRR